MDKAELNRLAAEKIMGWGLHANKLWYTKPETLEIIQNISLWHPCDNIAQAFELADKILSIHEVTFQLRRSVKTLKWYCVFNGLSGAIEETRALALTIACLRAAGEEV